MNELHKIDYELESRKHDYFISENDYNMEIPDEFFEDIELTEIDKEKRKTIK